jgi:hypothetical protein
MPPQIGLNVVSKTRTQEFSKFILQTRSCVVLVTLGDVDRTKVGGTSLVGVVVSINK